jgi:hypothetical protein
MPGHGKKQLRQMLGMEDIEDKSCEDDRKEYGGDVEASAQAFPPLTLWIEEYLPIGGLFHAPYVFLTSPGADCSAGGAGFSCAATSLRRRGFRRLVFPAAISRQKKGKAFLPPAVLSMPFRGT